MRKLTQKQLDDLLEEHDGFESHLDLSKTDISGLDINRLTMSNIDLSKSNCIGSTFKNMQLFLLNIEGSNLTGASFDNVWTFNLKANKANLIGVKLDGLYVSSELEFDGTVFHDDPEIGEIIFKMWNDHMLM